MLVRTLAADTFGEILRREGTEVEPLPDGALVVSGADAAAIGGLAHREGIVLHQLAMQSASLEEAFMFATGESGEHLIGEQPERGNHAEKTHRRRQSSAGTGPVATTQRKDPGAGREQ